jgi:hypothetical protein
MAVILRLPKDTKCRRTSKDPLGFCKGSGGGNW